MSVQSTRVTRHNSKSRPAAPQARARQLGSPPVTKPTRNPRAKTSPSSKSSSSTNNAQSNGSANNLISNLQQQVSQTLLSLLAVSLLFPCGPLAASVSLLPLCCLFAASLLPPCCLLASSNIYTFVVVLIRFVVFVFLFFCTATTTLRRHPSPKHHTNPRSDLLS